jgi:hypothetical protein
MVIVILNNGDIIEIQWIYHGHHRGHDGDRMGQSWDGGHITGCVINQ